MSGAETKAQPLSRRMSAADAAFLYLERKEIPLHIASVALFDGPVPFDAFVAAIDSKLHLVPRYWQIPVAPPLNIGHPTWEYDGGFDIGRHILRVRVDAPGGDAELEALAGRIFSQVMNRQKPLWEIHVVEGLAGGRGALIVKVHHALADGISGVALLQVMFDPTPEGSQAIRKPRFRPPEPAGHEDSLAGAISSALQGTFESLIAAETGIMALAQGLLSGGVQTLAGLAGVLPELAASVERLPFNKPCGAERRFCWAEVPFDEVQAIRAAAGCGRVNDVVLTVVTRAVSAYARLHGESVAGRYLRVVCPVSLRHGDNGESLGNRISFLPVALPMDVKDPVELLRIVTSRTDTMKNLRAADLVSLVGSWLGVAPPPVQAAFWQSLPYVTFPLPLLNMICTNIPGSPVPLYAAGRRMIASYPHVPTGYELGVGCAVQSYAGKLCFGLTSDAQAAPDADKLRDFILVAFDELRRAAGVKAAARPKPAVSARRAQAKVTAPRKRAARAPSPAATGTAPPQGAVQAPPVAATEQPAKPRAHAAAAASSGHAPVRPVEPSGEAVPQPPGKGTVA